MFLANDKPLISLVPVDGFEPPTHALRMPVSADRKRLILLGIHQSSSLLRPADGCGGVPCRVTWCQTSLSARQLPIAYLFGRVRRLKRHMVERFVLNRLRRIGSECPGSARLNDNPNLPDASTILLSYPARWDAWKRAGVPDPSLPYSAPTDAETWSGSASPSSSKAGGKGALAPPSASTWTWKSGISNTQTTVRPSASLVRIRYALPHVFDRRYQSETLPPFDTYERAASLQYVPGNRAKRGNQ